MAVTHFLSPYSDFGATSADWKGVVTGQPVDPISFTAKTTGNECGNYDPDGLGNYTASAVFTGLVYGRNMFWVDKNGGKPARISTTIYVTDLRPVGNVFTSVARFYEDPDDDAECVQDGVTWYKYSATRD